MKATIFNRFYSGVLNIAICIDAQKFLTQAIYLGMYGICQVAILKN